MGGNKFDLIDSGGKEMVIDDPPNVRRYPLNFMHLEL